MCIRDRGWAAHQQTDHFKAFVDTMLPRLEKRERVPYVPYTATKAYLSGDYLSR